MNIKNVIPTNKADRAKGVMPVITERQKLLTEEFNRIKKLLGQRPHFTTSESLANDIGKEMEVDNGTKKIFYKEQLNVRSLKLSFENHVLNVDFSLSSQQKPLTTYQQEKYYLVLGLGTLCDFATTKGLFDMQYTSFWDVINTMTENDYELLLNVLKQIKKEF